MSQPQPQQSNQSNRFDIFISYRREDSQATVDHIYEWLVRAFGRDATFKDVDAIPVGYSFPGYVNSKLAGARVALIVIGPAWTTVVAKDGPHTGQPRLVDPADHVRIEVERALALSPVNVAGEPISGLLLIPLLVQGARMPAREELPESLRSLPDRTARPIRYDPDFRHDMERLIGDMARWMGVPIPDMQGGHTPPTSVTPPPITPMNELVARLLPQIRDAYAQQDWPQVARLASYLQRNVQAEEIPTEVYQMQGRALLAERDYAGAKAAWDMVRQRDRLDVAALRAAAEARIALDTPAERAAALPLLDDALTLVGDRAQRLVLLRISVHVLTRLAHEEQGAAAQTHWTALLRTANEGLRLAGESDADWLATKREALCGLGQTSEALDVARTLTAQPGATVALWLTRARLAWTLAGEMPTDEVRSSLDAASRLAPQDAAIAAARGGLLAIITPDRFPPRLAQLGFVANTRNGVAFITPPVCQIGAGEFLMGSDPRRDNQASSAEQPQHRVNLAAYAIARYPVTVAEYACFVEDKTANQRQPSDWANQLQKLDHPVVSVSWDDAVAYAAWLAKLTGQPWRLPTEAEWEKAARWDVRSGVARLYPWGDTFDPSRANTSESGKHGTTAVGSYPTGASLYGAEEMAGNVWEWTHSLYKPYPYTQSDGREVENSTGNRVLRGGSWSDLSPDARAAYRFQGGAGYLDVGSGFRLVLSGPGSAIH